MSVQPSPANSSLVELGYICGVFGTHGWVKVHSYTRPRAHLLDYREWMIGQRQEWRKFSIIEHKVHGPSLLVKLSDITAREQAVTLLRQIVAIPRDALPSTGPNEYYWADLAGCTVFNREQQPLGTVRHLVEAGDHDVLVIRGEREYLVPFVLDVYVLNVDLAQRRIVVDWNLDD
jgi:16S rRNA processing protein RimM